MTRTEKLKTALKYWYEGMGYQNAIRAMHVAQRIHTGFRKDGVTPEIFHQISVAGYLKTINEGVMHPEAVQIAAWLHDSAEDYLSDYSFMMLRFGKEFDAIVPHAINTLAKTGLTTETYYENLSMCPVASIVKGADRIHNHQTMSGVFSAEKQAEYIKETQDFVIPMLKEARMSFPEQTNAYYNIIHILRTQIELLEGIKP